MLEPYGDGGSHDDDGDDCDEMSGQPNTYCEDDDEDDDDDDDEVSGRSTPSCNNDDDDDDDDDHDECIALARYSGWRMRRC